MNPIRPGMAGKRTPKGRSIIDGLALAAGSNKTPREKIETHTVKNKVLTPSPPQKVLVESSSSLERWHTGLSERYAVAHGTGQRCSKTNPRATIFIIVRC